MANEELGIKNGFLRIQNHFLASRKKLKQSQYI